MALLKDGAPQAVWTGSTNGTEGAIHGPLNLTQAVCDPAVAQAYESYFQLLHREAEVVSPREIERTLACRLRPFPDTTGRISPIKGLNLGN
ncbi:MAG: hypothetical protein ABSF61_02590 [Anaerolineales bacterium]